MRYFANPRTFSKSINTARKVHTVNRQVQFRSDKQGNVIDGVRSAVPSSTLEVSSLEQLDRYGEGQRESAASVANLSWGSRHETARHLAACLALFEPLQTMEGLQSGSSASLTFASRRITGSSVEPMPKRKRLLPSPGVAEWWKAWPRKAVGRMSMSSSSNWSRCV